MRKVFKNIFLFKIFLQRTDRPVLVPLGLDALKRGPGGGKRGHQRDIVNYRAPSDGIAVGAAHFAGRGVDDKADLLVLDDIKHVGAALGNLVHFLDG